MTEKGTVPQIFDDKLRSLRRTRAGRRLASTGVSFLLERCIDDLADRLLDVNRQFRHAVVIGPHDLRNSLRDRLPAEKYPVQLDYFSSVEELEPKVDLIISLLDLQSENDLPGMMLKMAEKLSPDGLFIAAMFGGETLTELRQSLYKTDEQLLGGLTARVYPMVTHSQAAPLLVRAGLNLPVVDMDRFRVSYSTLSKLVGDLRDLGETNILSSRSDTYVGKAYLNKLKDNYSELFSEKGKLTASFEILWLTGWKPHESQPKPLKPGSAKVRLADALGSHEQKI